MGTSYFPIHPLNTDKLKIVYEREENEIFYRAKLSSSILLADYQYRGEEIRDFSTLYSNAFDMKRKINFLVYSGPVSNPASENPVYTGVFSLYEGNWDLSLRQFEVKVETQDRYHELLLNKDTKVNILNIPPDQGFTEDNEYGLEYTYEAARERTEIGTACEVADRYLEFFREDAAIIVDSKGWQLYKLETRAYTPYNTYSERGIQVKPTYFRRTKLIPGEKDKHALPGDEWIRIGSKTINNYPFQLYATVPYPDQSSYEQTVTSTDDVCTLELRNSSDIRKHSRGRSLGAVIKHVLEKTMEGKDTLIRTDTYTTSIFDGFPEYAHLAIVHNSDFINYDSSEPASMGEVSFAELMESLRKMFQIYWYIDDFGYLRLLPYRTNYVRSVETADLTGLELKRYISYANKLHSRWDKLPSKEVFNSLNAEQIDFTGLPIDYTDYTNVKKEKEYNTGIFTTDIVSLRLGGKDAATDGFSLIALENVIALNENQFTILINRDSNGFESITNSGDVWTLDAENNNSYADSNQISTAKGDVVSVFFEYTDMHIGYINVYMRDSISGSGSDLTKLAKIEDASGYFFHQYVVKNPGPVNLEFSNGVGPCEISLKNILITTQRLRIRHDRSLFTELQMPNIALGWPYLQERLWKQHRPFPTGKMNGEQTTFEDHDITGGRPFVQRGFSLPLCKSGIDPVSLIKNPDELVMVKTDIGDGMVEKLELELGTDIAKFDLAYTKIPIC